LGEAIGGASRFAQAMSAVALPALESFLGRLSAGGDVGERFGALLIDATETVAKGFAHVSDFLHLFIGKFKELQFASTIAFLAITEGAIVAQKALIGTINLIAKAAGSDVEVKSNGILEALSAGLVEDAKQLKVEIDHAFEVFDQGSGAKAVGRFFQDVRNEMRKGTENAGIDKALDEFFDFKEMPKKLGEAVDETLNALVDESLDSFFNDVEVQAGKLATLKDDAKPKSPLTRMNHDLGDELAPFIREGSADAIRMSFRAERDATRDAVPQRQLDEAKRQSDLLERIHDRLDFEVG
jgi:hypothetical protein